MNDDVFLPGLPVNLIRAAYVAAPGHEIDSGKFLSPESSSALVANAFGLFLDRATLMPPLPRTQDFGWPAASVELEAIVRFPWSGGRHPCLDVLVVTRDALIGIESKRFEPFRHHDWEPMSDAYWRPEWGAQMLGYERLRDALRDNNKIFDRLDAAQLIKHAFGLRTAVHKDLKWAGKIPLLYYLYAEPARWPIENRSISPLDRIRHRAEIDAFSTQVKGSEVLFRYCSYCELLADWMGQADPLVRAHAAAIAERFSI